LIATIIFLLAVAVLFYIVVGYPLLAASLARRAPVVTVDGDELPTVSVILPVHNGEPFLAAKLHSVLGLDYPKDRMQILVIDDGSTDATSTIAANFADRGVKVLSQTKSGKATALNLGISHASGEILLLTDVRQLLEPDGLRYLIARLADPHVGVASGHLIVRTGDREESTVGLYWRYESWIRKQLGRIDSIFGATGPYYAMRRDLAVPIPAECLLDDMYLPLAAFFRGYRLVVEERSIAHDYPTGLETEFGRKVRTLAGNYQILGQYPELLTFRNRMLFHFLSYKVGRLLMPWLVLTVTVTSFGLPHPWAALAIGLQGAFCGLAALDLFVPVHSRLKRLTASPRTLVSLLAATLVALCIFFVPPQKLWKTTRVRLEER
jgi:cellulose synthase/poly-beta-1,6-N-acetylglucosamine synthase-like glycosyltransferase